VNQTIILPRMCASGTAERACKVIQALPSDRAWRIEIAEHKRKRSDDQNRYLWGAVYPSILNAGAEQLRGWTAEDLHEFFLGEIYGWEVIEGFGRKRMKPVRRSSKMNTAEFAEYVSRIQQRMAELGIYVPDPELRIAA
jgi:hypothetical protein